MKVKYDLKHHLIFKQVVNINKVNPIKELRQKCACSIIYWSYIIILDPGMSQDVNVDVFTITGHWTAVVCRQGCKEKASAVQEDDVCPVKQQFDKNRPLFITDKILNGIQEILNIRTSVCKHLSVNMSVKVSVNICPLTSVHECVCENLFVNICEHVREHVCDRSRDLSVNWILRESESCIKTKTLVTRVIPPEWLKTKKNKALGWPSQCSDPPVRTGHVRKLTITPELKLFCTEYWTKVPPSHTGQDWSTATVNI